MDYDPTDLRKQQLTREDAEELQKLEAAQEVGDFKWLMSGVKGRRLVRRLLEKSGVYRLSFHTNAMQMSFNEGNRNYGNTILAIVMHHCPGDYIKLLDEGKEPNA